MVSESHLLQALEGLTRKNKESVEEEEVAIVPAGPAFFIPIGVKETTVFAMVPAETPNSFSQYADNSIT